MTRNQLIRAVHSLAKKYGYRVHEQHHAGLYDPHLKDWGVKGVRVVLDALDDGENFADFHVSDDGVPFIDAAFAEELRKKTRSTKAVVGRLGDSHPEDGVCVTLHEPRGLK